jgi:TolB-like protein/cytochrome c-type biogenesis protein CcmH/NrfG
VAIGYVVSCWLLIQVADIGLETIGAPDWVMKTIMLIVALGFPVVVFFSWAYEVTPDGIKRESEIDRNQSITHVTGRKLDRAIIAVLIVALAWFAWDKFYPATKHEADQATGARQAATEPLSIAVPPAADSNPSIAVLPFVNMSADAANEYFSDGLSEEILNLLTRVSGLKVIARTSSFAFKGKNQDLREVGDVLGVKNVLEGSVRKSGDRVRITAQLINVADGSHIWSESYDRTLTDIFLIQDDVAAAIVDALMVHVSSAPSRGRPTENSEAYDLFLQARALQARGGPGVLAEAVGLLRSAIALDPQFAEAYELLAMTYWYMAGTEVKSGEGQRLTFEAAEHALALDPGLVTARALLRSADLDNYSWLGEIQAFEQVLQEQPGNTGALDGLVFDLIEAGYLNEAAVYAERLIALDPLSDMAKLRYAESLGSLGRLEVETALAHPFLLSNLYINTGQYDQAAEAYAASLRSAGFADTAWVNEAIRKSRDPHTGQEYLDTLIAAKVASLPDDQRFNAWTTLVAWYLGLGYLDRYFEIIQSLDLTSSTWTDADWLVYMGTVARTVTGFTAHPKYLEVADSIGLSAVWDQRGAPDFCYKKDSDWFCE